MLLLNSTNTQISKNNLNKKINNNKNTNIKKTVKFFKNLNKLTQKILRIISKILIIFKIRNNNFQI